MESREQAREFLTGEPVAELTGEEFPKGDRSLVAMVQEQYRAEWGGQVERPGLGTVKLTRKGIKASLGHGIGRAKVVAFAAVPEVVRSGMEVGKREGALGVSPRLTVAAPITIAGVPHVAVVILKSQARTHSFYLHEVVITERLQQPFKTGSVASAEAEGANPSGAGAIKTLLQDIFDVKQDGEVKPASSRVEPTSSETTPVSIQPAGFKGRMPSGTGDVKRVGDQEYLAAVEAESQLPNAAAIASEYGRGQCHVLTTAMVEAYPGATAYGLYDNRGEDEIVHSLVKLWGKEQYVDAFGSVFGQEGLRRRAEGFLDSEYLEWRVLPDDDVARLVGMDRTRRVRRATKVAKALMREAENQTEPKADVRYSVRKRGEEGGNGGNGEERRTSNVERRTSNEEGEKTGWRAALEDGWKLVERMWKNPRRAAKLMRGENANGRPELFAGETFLKTISHYADKFPALRKMYDAARNGTRIRWEMRHQIFRNDATGEDDLDFLTGLERRDRETYRAGNEYLFEMDREARGGEVKPIRSGDEDSPVIGYAAESADGRSLGRFGAESDGWRAVYDDEASRLKAERGLPFADMVRRVRAVNLRTYLQMKHGVEAVVKEREEGGEERPAVVTYKLEDGETRQVDLFAALREMGERLGYYMPRLRGNGRSVLKAYDESGRMVWRDQFDTAWARGLAQMRLESENPGWVFKQEASTRPSEDAYAGAFQIADLNDIVNRALARMDEGTEGTTLEDFGLVARRVMYTRKKDGKEEEHLVLVPTRRNSEQAQVLKGVFGAQFYDDGQTGTGEGWHVVNPSKGEEARILGVLREAGGIPDGALVEGLARSFAMTMADVLHERGSRARKIGRSEATGGDVIRGYSEDTIHALARNGSAIAGGTAKSETLRAMMAAFVGMDESWRDFWARRRTEVFPDGTATVEEERTARVLAWSEFKAQVQERRIDSATQPRMYQEAKSYLLDIFRNEEGLERMFGVARGVAALKFLSGVAPALVNLTAMGTTVPAVLAEAGAKSRTLPRVLARATRDYGKYMAAAKWGKGEGVDGETQALLDEFAERGWDEQQFHRASTEAMKSKMGRGLGRVMDAVMLPFGLTERLNRGSTLLAGFRVLEGLHPDWDREQVMQGAKDLSDRAHGQYGKENLWAPARGGALGSQILRNMYMYRTFPHTMIQTTAQMVVRGGKALYQKDGAAAKANLTGVAWMALAPAVIGGASASLLVPLAKMVFSAFGSEPPEEVEEGFYAWLAENFGDGGERLGRFGLAGLVGLNLKGSLATNPMALPIDLTTPPRSWLELMGPMGSMLRDVGRMPDLAARGQWLRAFETGLAPRIAKGPLRAFREMTEGPTRWSGGQVRDDEGKPLQPTVWDSALRALGANPARIARDMEKQWHEKTIGRFYREYRSELYSRARRMGRDASEGEWAELMTDIQQYNAMAAASSTPGVTTISDRTLKGVLTREERAGKGRQERAGREPRKGRVRRQPRVGR